MIEINTPEINVDEIMARIRKEAKQQNKKFPFSPCPSFSSHTIRPEAHPLPRKEFYALSDFLGYHDSDFIDNAYFSVLRRSPDSEGKKLYLAKLQKGELTKVDIVGRLRYSPEGRSKKVPVKGLLLPFIFQTFFKMPVLGWGLRIVTGLLNLPTILKNIQAIENAAFTQNHFSRDQAEKTLSYLFELRDHIAELQEEIIQAQSAQKSELKEAVAELQEEIIQAQSAQKSELKEAVARLQEEITRAQSAQKSEMEEAIAELSKQIKGQNLPILDMQRTMQLLLEEARKRLPEPISIEQIENMVKEEDHLLDAMYVDFENKFRGTREKVKERVKVYLPYVEDALKAANDALVLDIGCGRGEWLEILKENDIIAKGLDLNRIMVAQCRDLGLDVIESDMIEYLRNLKNNTLSVVTGFHIVEHLPFKTLITLFDESLRVLKPGGLVIFETPNPENLFVGACNFYTDPSHKNPIPPTTLEFLLESRGFIKNKIHRLHPMKEVRYVEDEALKDLNELLHAVSKEQDYALIGYKE